MAMANTGEEERYQQVLQMLNTVSQPMPITRGEIIGPYRECPHCGATVYHEKCEYCGGSTGGY